MKRCVVFLLVLVICLSVLPVTGSAAGLENFGQKNTYPNAFTDVKGTDWFYENVKAVYELGLMVGSSESTFSPNGSVTLAETLVIAARLHSIYHTGKESFEQQTPWYQTYVDYAAENGIYMDGISDYGARATRTQFAMILDSAMPQEAYAQINTVEDGAIPDVSVKDVCAGAVYRLYRAGIMIGSDSAGTFKPQTGIQRSEVATIVSRMADVSLRKTVELTAASKPEPEADPDAAALEMLTSYVWMNGIQSYSAYRFFPNGTGTKYFVEHPYNQNGQIVYIQSWDHTKADSLKDAMITAYESFAYKLENGLLYIQSEGSSDWIELTPATRTDSTINWGEGYISNRFIQGLAEDQVFYAEANWKDQGDGYEWLYIIPTIIPAENLK